MSKEKPLHIIIRAIINHLRPEVCIDSGPLASLKSEIGNSQDGSRVFGRGASLNEEPLLRAARMLCLGSDEDKFFESFYKAQFEKFGFMGGEFMSPLYTPAHVAVAAVVARYCLREGARLRAMQWMRYLHRIMHIASVNVGSCERVIVLPNGQVGSKKNIHGTQVVLAGSRHDAATSIDNGLLTRIYKMLRGIERKGPNVNKSPMTEGCLSILAFILGWEVLPSGVMVESAASEELRGAVGLSRNAGPLFIADIKEEHLPIVKTPYLIRRKSGNIVESMFLVDTPAMLPSRNKGMYAIARYNRLRGALSLTSPFPMNEKKIMLRGTTRIDGCLFEMTEASTGNQNCFVLEEEDVTHQWRLYTAKERAKIEKDKEQPPKKIKGPEPDKRAKVTVPPKDQKKRERKKRKNCFQRLFGG